MALDNVIPGFTVASGTWGTDIDESTTVTQTGGRSIHFKSTAVVAYLRSALIPVEQADLYIVECLVRSDDVAGADVRLKILAYDDDGVTSSETQVVFDTELQAANTWEHYRYYWSPGDAGTRWAQIEFGRTDANYNVYFDWVSIKRAIYSFHAYLGAAQNVVTGDVIEFDTLDSYNIGPSGAGTHDHNHGAAYDSAVNYRYDIPASGFWVFWAGTKMEALANAEYMKAEIFKNNVRLKLRGAVYNWGVNPAALHDDPSTGPVWFDAGDFVDVRAFHNHGPARVLTAGLDTTFFYGYQIRG